jgi:hypothetical protein
VVFTALISLCFDRDSILGCHCHLSFGRSLIMTQSSFYRLVLVGGNWWFTGCCEITFPLLKGFECRH